ncbi:hypothetical protein FRX31_008119 [Thalictrum thalictroides]|uniref:Uncharacterized protein n=1 Tax=Thalictrum thalictroides TaxID=46969 RepID=A0A7J6WXY9_THATH|nr:hypothetical protein FRX31_008119 [Thalictrum thalictroides]
MSAYRWPKSVIKQGERILRNFIWSGNPAISRAVTVRWDDCCKPVMEGGIGMRRLGDVNKALMMKMAWTCLTEDNLFARFMGAKYRNKDGDFIQHYKQSSIWAGLK